MRVEEDNGLKMSLFGILAGAIVSILIILVLSLIILNQKADSKRGFSNENMGAVGEFMKKARQ